MSGFGFDDKPRPPKAFVQWKGTDACLDLECECGWSAHWDGYFAYNWRCGGCGKVWEAPNYISYRESQDDPRTACIVEPEGEPGAATIARANAAEPPDSGKPSSY